MEMEMSGRKSTTFTEVELEFMQIIWDLGSVSTEDMQKHLGDKGRDLADGSIRKIFSILMKKGHLQRIKEGRSYIYSPKVVREQAKSNMILDLLKRGFSDSVPGMVATLLNSKNISSNDLEEIKNLLDSYEDKKEETK